MIISELTDSNIKGYLRIPESDAEATVLAMAKDSALGYICAQTGIPAEELDHYPDLTLAYLVLIQDAYDNRSMVSESAGANRVVQSILANHVRNLI